jgi:hypothetical protein
VLPAYDVYPFGFAHSLPLSPRSGLDRLHCRRLLPARRTGRRRRRVPARVAVGRRRGQRRRACLGTLRAADGMGLDAIFNRHAL